MRRVGVLAMVVMGSTTTHAQDSESQKEARETAVEAFDAYMREDFTSAAALYERSFGMQAEKSVLYDLARMASKTGNDKRAEVAYRRYLRDETTTEDPGRRSRATTELAAVAMGKRTEPPTLPPLPNPPPFATPAAPSARLTRTSPSRRSPLFVASAVSASTGLAALGVGAGLSVLARRYAEVTRDVCEGNMCWSHRGIEAASSGRRIANAATAMLISGGAVSALSVTLFLVQRGAPHRDRAQLEIQPFASSSSAGASMKGQW